MNKSGKVMNLKRVNLNENSLDPSSGSEAPSSLKEKGFNQNLEPGRKPEVRVERPAPTGLAGEYNLEDPEGRREAVSRLLKAIFQPAFEQSGIPPEGQQAVLEWMADDPVMQSLAVNYLQKIKSTE